jgi:hypothetical protein
LDFWSRCVRVSGFALASPELKKSQNWAQPSQRVRDTSLRTPFVGVRQGAGSLRRKGECGHPRPDREPALKD